MDRVTNLCELEALFAETAEGMRRKPRSGKPKDDPRIQELVKQRAELRRSHDGRERFRITTEIRKLITKSTRDKKREAIKCAFARHTNWARISEELRINRPTAPPVFRIDGKSITSEEEAIAAMAGYIEQVYAEPTRPINIPLWDLGHGVQAGELAESIGVAVASIKAGKAADISGLSSACMKGLMQEAVEKNSGAPEEESGLTAGRLEEITGSFPPQQRGQGSPQQLQIVEHFTHDVEIYGGGFRAAA